jgi:hypothetical protein
LVRLLTIFAAYLSFHGYLCTWFPSGRALIGTLFLAASVPLTFVTNWWEIISDFPELLVFTLALGYLHQRRVVGLAVVVLIGTLNRETTALLVVIAAVFVALDGLKGRRDLRPFVAAFAGWALPTLALRWWFLAPPPAAALADRFYLVEHNIVGLAQLLVKPHPYNAYLLPVYLFGLFWLLPLRVLGVLPRALQAGLVAVPLLVVLVFTVGGLNEPRQLMSLYPVLVPSSLFALFPGTAAAERGPFSSPGVCDT